MVETETTDVCQEMVNKAVEVMKKECKLLVVRLVICFDNTNSSYYLRN